jgi:uncharacterized membrane protein YccF (DUF307 family)
LSHPSRLWLVVSYLLRSSLRLAQRASSESHRRVIPFRALSELVAVHGFERTDRRASGWTAKDLDLNYHWRLFRITYLWIFTTHLVSSIKTISITIDLPIALSNLQVVVIRNAIQAQYN